MVEPNQLLRAWRQAAPSPAKPGFALSRSELAELVNATVYRRTGRVAAVDGHYVAKLERGVIRWPNDDYRRALREVLGAATDAELGFGRPRRGADAVPRFSSAVVAGDETQRERLSRALTGAHRVDRAVVAHLAKVLVAQHHVEDMLGALRMLPVTLAEIDLVESLVRQASGEVRTALVGLMAEYHLFAGRMADEYGDRRAALYHSDRSMVCAREVDDANSIAGVFGLKAHLAWGARDGSGTVELAQAGLRDRHRLSPAVAGFVAQMQARGHALRSEATAVERLIDMTERLTDQACAHPEDEPWWAYLQTPERALFQRGVACLELARYQEAGDLFERARTRLPASFRRDHGRWDAGLALARAHMGDVPGALTAGWQALAIGLDTGSVYTIADLRCLRQVLSRQQVDPAILHEFDQAFHEIIAPMPR